MNAAEREEFERQEREIYQAEKDLTEAKEVTKILTDYVNHRRSRTSKAFTEAFNREHNTLQQSVFKLMLELMEFMATEDYRTDGRNAESKKVAKRLLEGYKLMMKKEFMAQGDSEARAEQYASGECALPSKYLPLI